MPSSSKAMMRAQPAATAAAAPRPRTRPPSSRTAKVSAVEIAKAIGIGVAGAAVGGAAVAGLNRVIGVTPVKAALIVGAVNGVVVVAVDNRTIRNAATGGVVGCGALAAGSFVGGWGKKPGAEKKKDERKALPPGEVEVTNSVPQGAKPAAPKEKFRDAPLDPLEQMRAEIKRAWAGLNERSRVAA